jgi:hypothetical protein
MKNWDPKRQSWAPRVFYSPFLSDFKLRRNGGFSGMIVDRWIVNLMKGGFWVSFGLCDEKKN